MMIIKSDGTVQNISASILFHAFKELNYAQKRMFVKMLINENSRIEISTRIRQHDTDSSEEIGIKNNLH